MLHACTHAFIHKYIDTYKGDPSYMAATAASILSAPFINPVRMVSFLLLSPTPRLRIAIGAALTHDER